MAVVTIPVFAMWSLGLAACGLRVPRTDRKSWRWPRKPSPPGRRIDRTSILMVPLSFEPADTMKHSMTFQQSIRMSESDSDVSDKLFVLMTNVAIGRIDDVLSQLSSVEKELESSPPARNATIHRTLDSGNIAEAIECRLILSEARQVIDAIGDD